MGTVTGMGVGVRPSLTSFVGRRQELGRLRDLLSASRLITVTGPGGVGKTRLAEELATSLSRSFDGAIGIAYLAGVADGRDVVEMVANALGLTNRGSRPVRDELIDYLGDCRLLLVLDNCEHVVGASAELAADLLRACPGLLVIATSRQPLLVRGELLFPIDGLAPSWAGELFLDRARHALPDFAPANRAEDAQIATICSWLDGMPLAIELAAGHIRALGLAELVNRLDGRLSALGSRGVVGPERQRTIRGTIAWSYQLLPDEQRVAWRRLSVFSGGFTLDAAEQVLGYPPLMADEVANLVADLVDQSMVVFDSKSRRYRLIEALREVASEELREAGEEQAVRKRHGAWILGLAEDGDRRWFGPDQPAIADRLEAEMANLRAALENFESANDYAAGLRLANAAFGYWLTRASHEEGVRWYRRLVGRTGEPALEARAHWRAGYLSIIRLDFAAAHEFLEAGLELASRAGDDLDRVYAAGLHGFLMLYEEPARAHEARSIFATALAETAGDAMYRQWSQIGYGLACLALGDLDECRRHCSEGAELGRAVGEIWGRETGLRFVGEAEWRAGHHDAAEAALLECLRLDRELRDVWHMGWATESLAWVAVDAGRFERGARLLGIATEVWAHAGLSLGFPYRAWHDRTVETLRTRLGSRRFDAELAAGRVMSWDEAIAFALSETLPASAGGVAASPLSERELEIVALVAEGLTNRAIAERLFLSPRTVAKHVEHVMDKLGVGSRAEIASWHGRRSF